MASGEVCFIDEECDDFACDTSAAEIGQGIHIEEAGTFAVGYTVARRMVMQAYSAHSYYRTGFFGNCADVGAVRNKTGKIINIGLQKCFHIRRGRSCFALPAHSKTQFAEHIGIINISKTYFHKK